MGSTTSSDHHRCSFDANDGKSWHALVSCAICTRATLCAKMIKCVACHRLAHKKCIRGALRSDQRDGQQIAAKRHCSPAATAAFDTWTADDGSVMTGDSSARTRMTTCDIACGDSGVTSVEVACGDGEVTSADGCTQTCLSTAEVACGDGGFTYADGCTQTCVSTAEVACGDGGVTYVEVACGDGGIMSAEVACGDGEVTSADGCTQTCMSTAEVACGDDTTCANSFTQTTNVATRHVASSVIEAEHVNAEVPRKLRTMADMIAQMFNTDTTATAAPSTSDASTAPVQPEASAQKPQLRRTHKYWKQRYTLFSKFDEGIMLDEVSLFSTCPEVLAQHMAKKCSVRTVLDPFCGAGGNAIQLALTCHHVIAIDVDPRKIALARKNAEVYGVADRISFRVGNSFLEAANLRVDAVVTSPPRGEPVGCKRRAAKFDARTLCSREAGGMAAILRMARAAAPKVLLNVPMNIVKAQCTQMATKEGFTQVHYESIAIDGRPNSLNLYLRDDYSGRRAPIQTSTEVNLSTPPLFERQIMECAHDNNMSVYASYLDWVTRFLDAI